MRLARIKCAIGRHRPSAVRATRFADGWISRCGHCRAPMAYLEETGWFLAQGADRNEAVAARRFAQVAALGLAMVPLRRFRSNDVIDVLADLFIDHGTPEHIRSDNVLCWEAAAGTGQQISLRRV